MILNQKFIQDAIKNPSMAISCSDLHTESCNRKALDQFINASSSLSKMYLIAHLIPFLLKRKQLQSKPLQTLWRFLLDYAKSLFSAGLSSAVIRRLTCISTTYFGFDGHYTIPQGILSAVAFIIQSPSRRAEIALYCTAKSIEMGYNVLARRGLVKGLPKGEALVFGLAIAIIGYFYQQEPHNIKRSYFAIFKKILGDV